MVDAKHILESSKIYGPIELNFHSSTYKCPKHVKPPAVSKLPDVNVALVTWLLRQYPSIPRES